VPRALARPGSAPASSVNPERAPEDSPARGSYWWTFQRLLDVTKGDALGTAFTDRQPQVRAAFDPLENAWRAEVHDVLAEAAQERTQHGPEAGAEVLGRFSRRCVDEALTTADKLLERFSRGKQPVGPSA
jgi:hypothetical protein